MRIKHPKHIIFICNNSIYKIFYNSSTYNYSFNENYKQILGSIHCYFELSELLFDIFSGKEII